MKLFSTIIATIFLTSTVVISRSPDSTILQLRYSHHSWMRTSYDDASFQTNDFHMLFHPPQSCFAIELDAYFNLTGKQEMQRILEDFTGHEQPFPFGLQSFRPKLHLLHSVRLKDWLRFNRITVGKFHQNSPRYEYINFSRYVLHSPLDIEKRRSLADWGIYSEVELWKISIENFLLNSFNSNYTAGSQVRATIPISRAVTFTPVVNGILDRRTDESDNLAYSLGTDKTWSGSTLFQVQFKENKVLIKPLLAFNEHEFLSMESSRTGYLRNTEIVLRTPPFLKLPDNCGISRLGFQIDGIFEKNDSDYRPNFAYDSDELNDDFHRHIRFSHDSGLWSSADSALGSELPTFLYNRENVNIRLGESGGEAGIRMQGYDSEGEGDLQNVFNLGYKQARYSRTGGTHAVSFDDSWLAELEFRSRDGIVEFDLAYWQRKTNIVRDPDLEELQICTWIAGLRYILAKSALWGNTARVEDGETALAIFFRKDEFAELYESATAKERGSIFMALLQTPLFRSRRLGVDLDFLYRKYIPDNHIVARVFPPNNTIRISLNLSLRFDQ